MKKIFKWLWVLILVVFITIPLKKSFSDTRIKGKTKYIGGITACDCTVTKNTDCHCRIVR